MGTSQSKAQELKLISDHPALRDAKVIVEKDNKYIQARFKAQNEQYDEWRKHLQTGTSNLQSQFLLLPDKMNFKHDQGLCGNTGTLTNNYPNYPYTLEELIRQRQPQKKLFKEGELWYVLYALAAAKQDLKGRTPKLGDIKPENIFVNDDGKVKIANIYSWPNETPSFIRAIDQDKLSYNGLLAPEDMGQLQRGALDNDQNQQSEIFAIGATILSAGTLDNLSQVYNYRNKTFNVQAFRDKRRGWGENDRYSDIFKSIILNLTDVNAKQRLTMNELWQFVTVYSGSILDKKQFIINSAPAKVQRAFANLSSRNWN